MARSLRTKAAAGFLLGMIAFGTVGSLALPSVASAQLVTASNTMSDTPRTISEIIEDIAVNIKDALLQSVAVVLINTLSYAADRLAYDAAVFIASGGNGDGPLFENRSIGTYFADYGASVAGEAIGLIDDEHLLGSFSLCSPQTSDLQADVLLSFKLGVTALYQRPEPECDFSDIQDNWEGFMADLATMNADPVARNQEALEQLANVFDFRQNGLSSGVIMYTDIIAKAEQKQFYETQKLLFNSGFKDKTDFLTEKVDTPGELLKRDFTRKLEGPDDTRKQISLATVGDSDILLQLGLHAGQVFSNTLLSEFTKKIYSGLFSDLDDADVDPFDESDFASYDAEDARNSFRSFLAAAPLEITNYSILGEFSSCPSIGRGLYNCVADSSFISAVARADSGSPLTIQEAMDEGLLDENWPLIKSSDSARNQDQYCYTYGYCHSNLVKLRKARVISVGWELAADAEANTESDPATLGRVVSEFYDESSPYYHMIDPSWVLKYPDTQCRAQVYGQLLESSASDQRKEECVDMPSCIAEDGNGVCTGGYGYCVREENVWRFRGESCPDYYATCTEFEDPDGDDYSFLTNTIDSGPCDESNAGCMWYATQKSDTDGDDTFEWVETTDTASNAYQNRIYFTSAIEECDEDDAGCRELVRRNDDLSLNVLTNPGFEDDVDADGMPDGWFKGWFGTFTTFAPEYSTDAAHSLNGTSALSPGNETGLGAVYQTGIVLNQATTYTLSFAAAQSDTEYPDYVDAFFSISADEDGDGDIEVINPTGVEVSGDCSINSVSFDGGVTTYYTYAIEEKMPGDEGDGTYNTDYDRYSCTFSVPTVENAAADVIGTFFFTATSTYIDNVQLEQDSEASDWHEGYSDTSLDLAYVKVPPTYLGCTGGEDDPEECDGYAQVCDEEDVGCSAYTPTNGDPTVNGVANALDECPATCVGYDTFKQEPTLYEPEGDFPVYFIPDTAQECSDDEVGCDEFTNETTEELEYYTYLRACVTTDQADANISSDGAATFYTWEGSDLEGYQLVTWSLLESDLGSTTYAYPSGETDDEPGSAPCTNWTTTPSGIECDDDADGEATIDGSPINVDAACDEHSDIFSNPDCREFYDAAGGIHFREWSRTVTVNDSCVTYRKTEIVGDDATEKLANCTESGGYYNEDAGSCRYYGYAEESEGCSADAAGCREFTGGRSRNSRVAFTDLFEDGTLGNWDADSATTVTLSNESIATDGHSLASAGEEVWTFLFSDGECTDESGCASGEDTLGASCTVGYGDEQCGTLEGELYDDKTYTLSFWAKGTGTLSVGFDRGATSTNPTIDVSLSDIALEEGWNEYQLGPIDAAEYAEFGDDTVLVFTPDTDVDFYLDNVVLREGEDNITVIKDSWNTPAACDETPEGTSSPQYYLGCAEYTDQEGDTANLKSFSSLCNEDQVGCESFFMTQESDATTAKVYSAVCNLDLNGDGTNETATSATDCYMTILSGAFVADSQFLCTVGVGYNSCEFDLDVFIDSSTLPDHVSYVSSTTIVPADRDVFLVVNDDVECSSDVAGCTELGLPTFEQDHSGVASFESVYLVNDPDTYADTLCTYDELFCESYSTASNERFYFKNPQDQTCEYREGVTVSGTQYDGWFKTGTNDFCDEDYIIGGDFAGIWRNGDDDFANWAGVCESEYDTCSEFQDLTDIDGDELYGVADGTSYYYLNNDELDEGSLPDSQQCNGQVGQKDGCGLFNDTAESSKSFNISASYVASEHADDLFGEAPNSLVDPVSCEDEYVELSDGTRIDLCDMRCGYTNTELTGDSTETGYSFDGSCYDNSDCRPIAGETGLTVQGTCMSATANGGERLENDANTVLKVDRDRECSEWLACVDATTTWDERTNSFRTVCGDVDLCTEYSSAGNSSFCSDWNFDDEATVLDEDKYSERDVSWYGDDYSGYAVPELFPVQMLTQINVAPPAGLCNTNTLDGIAFANVHGDACEADADCGASDVDGDGTIEVSEGSGSCILEEEQDYRLAYVAGSCEGYDYNDSCSVGFCENTGEVCTDTDSCGAQGGNCIVGTCYDVATSGSCTTDADCASFSDTAICSGATCIDPLGELTIEDYTATVSCEDRFGGSNAQLYESVSTKTGSCMREQCVLTPDGTTFDRNMSEDMVCRAYPEIDSPFPTEIVEEWLNPVDDETVSESADGYLGAVPYSKRSGFDMAKACSPGEDCECSYKKLTYGQGAATRYYATDSEFPYGNGTSFQRVGICSGGDHDGSYCTDDADLYNDASTTVDGYSFIPATTCESNSGVCMYPTKEDTMLGMEGFCLERDSGTNILGDRNQHACLTWLPVDQLAGSTDLYAKYTEAGYDGGDTYYCAYVEPYVDFYTSHVGTPGANSKDEKSSEDEIAIACSEYDSEVESNGGSTMDACVHETFACPIGYYAIVGKPDNADGDAAGNFGGSCSTGGGADPDCPFACVPVGATSSDGASCNPPSGSGVYETTVTGSYGGYDYDVDVYYLDGWDSFDNAVINRQDCITTGAEYVLAGITTVNSDALDDYEDCHETGQTSVIGEENTTYTDSDLNIYTACQDVQVEDGGGGYRGWYNLITRVSTPYLACSKLIQVADGDFTNAAYTDRVLNESNVTPLVTSDSFEDTSDDYTVDAAKFAYTRSTSLWPFGASLTQNATNDDNPRPPAIAHCVDTTDPDHNPTFSAPTIAGECTIGGPGRHADDLTQPEARSFVDFYGYLNNITYDFSVSYFGVDSTIGGGTASVTSAASLMSQVFAKSIGWTWFDDGLRDQNGVPKDEFDAGSMTTGTSTTSLSEWDYDMTDWDERADEGVPPTVMAVKTDTCVGDQCEEDEDHNLTLGDQNSGNIQSTDFYRAYLKFYAAAFKEQLPIRRVIVDWQDGADMMGSTSPDNYYKNHRGLQEGEENSICERQDLGEDYEWGMTDESCDPYYFSYSHIYTCENPSALPTCSVDDDGDLAVSPCSFDGDSCSYQPRVHVRDNWGWCTGTCDDENYNADGTDGCFDADDYGLSNSAIPQDECALSNPVDDYPGMDPWVYYDGYVTVSSND